MDLNGLNKRCFLCGRLITQEDFDKKNGAMRKGGMPGFFHLKCFVEIDATIILNPVKTEDLSQEVNNILGDNINDK